MIEVENYFLKSNVNVGIYIQAFIHIQVLFPKIRSGKKEYNA